LRGARHQAGLTQEELARKAGLSVRAISDLERGLTARPRQGSLRLLATALSSLDLASTVAAAPAGLPVPAQLPAGISDFTGRVDQVDSLRQLLRGRPGAGPGAVRVVLVMGTGGVGKTALAVHAAHLLAGQFPDGQLYANLRGATSACDPAEVLARFLRDLGADPASIPASMEERAALYRTCLAGRRTMVILDDAGDAAQVTPLLPGSASCAVLVTSRHAMPEIAGAPAIVLGVLPPGEAHELFTRVCGPQRAAAEPDATAEVLAACAGLPLAIRIAGARLAARTGWTVRHLAGRLADERRRLDELRAGNLAVRASFEVSFAALPRTAAGEADPATAFRLLGLWTGPSISLSAAAALLGHGHDPVAQALDVLIDAHLLETPRPDRYLFHDLLRVYAAERARTEATPGVRRQAITRILTWYLHTSQNAGRTIAPIHWRVPLAPPPPQVEPLRFSSRVQALAWCESEREGMVAAAHLAAGTGQHELAWKLPAAAMSFYYRCGHWADWVTTHQAGLASARAAGDRAGEAWMLNNLGMATGVQHLEEAVSLCEQAVTLYRELEDTQGEARAANNVAGTYFKTGRFEQALEAARHSLAVQRRAGSGYGVAIAFGVMGASCRELGMLDAAIEHLRQAVGIFRQIREGDTGADALSDLGKTYLALKRPEEAISCLRESLEIGEALGCRHSQVMTLRRLSHAYQQADRPEQAAGMLDAARLLAEEVGDSAEAAEIAGDLARLEDR
jgi:tetratricopeptide (TPR) repeat protein/transcriptional regulator with XRE-family HTH domain